LTLSQFVNTNGTEPRQLTDLPRAFAPPTRFSTFDDAWPPAVGAVVLHDKPLLSRLQRL
jgi:hypothetical protein